MTVDQRLAQSQDTPREQFSKLDLVPIELLVFDGNLVNRSTWFESVVGVGRVAIRCDQYLVDEWEAVHCLRFIHVDQDIVDLALVRFQGYTTSIGIA